MANKIMKRWSTLNVSKDMQIKTMMRCHFCLLDGLLEWSKSRGLAILNADKDVEQYELSFIIRGNEKWHCHFKYSLMIYNTSKLLPFDSAMTLVGIYPNELKTKTCKQMFIEALFIAKTWK